MKWASFCPFTGETSKHSPRRRGVRCRVAEVHESGKPNSHSKDFGVPPILQEGVYDCVFMQSLHSKLWQLDRTK